MSKKTKTNDSKDSKNSQNSKDSKKRKTKLKIAVNVVLCLILALLALIIFSAIYTKSTGKQLLPYTAYWVLSPSMEPDIPVRSYILVKKTTAAEVEVGDVISFRSQDPSIKGQLNTHRVTEVIGDHEQFHTKGDNNALPDNYPVNAEDVEAKYVCNLAVMTAFGRLFASKLGLAFVFVAVFFGIAAWFIINALKKNGAEPTKEEKNAEIERLIAEEVERLKKEGAQPVGTDDKTSDGDGKNGGGSDEVR